MTCYCDCVFLESQNILNRPQSRHCFIYHYSLEICKDTFSGHLETSSIISSVAVGNRISGVAEVPIPSMMGSCMFGHIDDD